MNNEWAPDLTIFFRRFLNTPELPDLFVHVQVPELPSSEEKQRDEHEKEIPGEPREGLYKYHIFQALSNKVGSPSLNSGPKGPKQQRVKDADEPIGQIE